eukprot:2890560-Pyramimonas_sp.AAC.1
MAMMGEQEGEGARRGRTPEGKNAGWGRQEEEAAGRDRTRRRGRRSRQRHEDKGGGGRRGARIQEIRPQRRTSASAPRSASDRAPEGAQRNGRVEWRNGRGEGSG